MAALGSASASGGPSFYRRVEIAIVLFMIVMYDARPRSVILFLALVLVFGYFISLRKTPCMYCLVIVPKDEFLT
jgi:hypothetical protein